MRYRSLDENGDYSFGRGRANFLADSPAAVAQAVGTRLALLQGEWFLDTTEGTPYAAQIIGKGGKLLADRALRDRILGTPGVTEIASYASTLAGRSLIVQATLNTQYGMATIEQTL